MGATAAQAPYPVQLAAEYADQQSRWKALLRLPLSVPVLAFSSLLLGGAAPAMWAAILVSGRIPRWLFEFQVAVIRWQVRGASYALLLTDAYPPFEGDHPIRYQVEQPERVSRWRLVVWKLLSSIPHFFVLAALGLSLVVVVPVGWLAILLTGRFPERLHRYAAGVLRWATRVLAYVLSLTDEFPPFSLSADAGAGGRAAYASSSAVGVLSVGSVVAFFAVLGITKLGGITTEVSYSRLLAGELRSGETYVQVDSAEDALDSTRTGSVELTGAADPADDTVPLLAPEPGHRFVRFDLTLENENYEAFDVSSGDFSLKDDDGNRNGAVLVVVDGRIPPFDIDQGEFASAVVVFELPAGVNPAELRFAIEHHVHRAVTYKFR